MDKTESKYRDIQFYSEKNKSLMSVHSKDAKAYADLLEASPHVVKYKCILPLDPGFMEEVSRLGIRPECFGIAWASDFWIENLPSRSWSCRAGTGSSLTWMTGKSWS